MQKRGEVFLTAALLVLGALFVSSNLPPTGFATHNLPGIILATTCPQNYLSAGKINVHEAYSSKTLTPVSIADYQYLGFIGSGQPSTGDVHFCIPTTMGAELKVTQTAIQGQTICPQGYTKAISLVPATTPNVNVNLCAKVGSVYSRINYVYATDRVEARNYPIFLNKCPSNTYPAGILTSPSYYQICSPLAKPMPAVARGPLAPTLRGRQIIPGQIQAPTIRYPTPTPVLQPTGPSGPSAPVAAPKFVVPTIPQPLAVGTPSTTLIISKDDCSSQIETCPSDATIAGALHTGPAFCDSFPEGYSTSSKALDSGWLTVCSQNKQSTLIIAEDDCTKSKASCPSDYKRVGSIHTGPGKCDEYPEGTANGNTLNTGWMGFCTKNEDTIVTIERDDCGSTPKETCPQGYALIGTVHTGQYLFKDTTKQYSEWSKYKPCDSYPEGISTSGKSIDSGWLGICAKKTTAVAAPTAPSAPLTNVTPTIPTAPTSPISPTLSAPSVPSGPTAPSGPAPSAAAPSAPIAPISPTAPIGAACVNPPSNLVGWWSAEGNANDQTGNNNGALKNGATFASGLVGQAFNLDGVDDYVSIAKKVIGDGTSYTLESWVKTNNAQATQYILRNIYASAYCSPSRKGHDWYIQNSKIGFENTGSNNCADQVVSNTILQSGIWYHVAIVRDIAANTLSIYINGILDNQITTKNPGSLDYGPINNIGGDYPPYPAVARWFNGLVDELSMYNKALSASEIKSIYNAANKGKCKTATATTVAPTAPAANQNPKGWLDKSDCTSFAGWACDLDNSTAPLEITFYSDGVDVGKISANQQREQAVGTQCGGNQNHGYTFSTPATLKDSKTHKIEAKAKDINTNALTQLSGSPKSVTCTAPQAAPVTAYTPKILIIPESSATSNCPSGTTIFMVSGHNHIWKPNVANPTSMNDFASARSSATADWASICLPQFAQTGDFLHGSTGALISMPFTSAQQCTQGQIPCCPSGYSWIGYAAYGYNDVRSEVVLDRGVARSGGNMPLCSKLTSYVADVIAQDVTGDGSAGATGISTSKIPCPGGYTSAGIVSEPNPASTGKFLYTHFCTK